jgi:TatD DNase family protein
MNSELRTPNFELRTKLIDTHCHLDFPEFNQDLDEVIRRAKDSGVDYIVNIGSSLAGSESSIMLAHKYPCIWAAVGIHPHDADKCDNKSSIVLEELARKEKVVAIGEIGLDYFKNFSKAKNQRLLFLSLVRLAKKLDLPIVVHSRDAQSETLEILKEEMPLKVVVHCFSGNEDFLKECLNLEFLVSFTCNITYKKAQGLRDLVRLTPLDRLMLETDAPFLAPEGFRGKRNEPMHVKLLAEEIARIKGISFEEVAQVTTNNATKFFNI